MKIVKSTFESLLEEIDDIYLRIDDTDGVKSLVAGGINRNGMWIEFPSRLSKGANMQDIVRSLEVMVYMMQEERKKWHVEKGRYSLIREMGKNLN